VGAENVIRRSGSLQVTLFGQVHVDDLSVLVNGSVDVPPRPGDLHVGLVDEPVATDYRRYGDKAGPRPPATA
jgi:hypothetical protein